MLNRRTRLQSRGNTQAQGPNERKATPGTQGLLGTMRQGDTPYLISPNARNRKDQDENCSLSAAEPDVESLTDCPMMLVCSPR